MVARRCPVAAIAAALALTAASTASAGGVTKLRAESVAKRAASARVERFGISYPPGAWRAACRARAAGGWRCDVGTDGQCSGVVTVTGSSAHPRARGIDVWCLG